MTRVFVMGAVGEMCIEATRDLVATTDYDEFLLADLNQPRLEELKGELKDKRVRTVRIDATDLGQVSSAIKGYDIVMNGLTFGTAQTTIRACLKSRIPTILLDDFPMPEYKGFEQAGVLCAAGVGMTPGTTDMMVRSSVQQCDSVDEVHVSWASFRPIAISPGLVLTTFWEMDPQEKDRAYYDRGKFHPQPPLRESKTVEFAKPFGRLQVYYVPHPETVNFARLVPGVKKVVTMGTWPPVEMELLKQLIDFGIYERKSIQHNGQNLNTLEIVGEMLHQLPRGRRTELWGYALHTEVRGRQGGKDITLTLTTSHPHFSKWGGSRAYAKNVAIPMSIGAQLILEGRIIVSRGYHCAYEVFEPTDFFAELNKRGIQVHEKCMTCSRYK